MELIADNFIKTLDVIREIIDNATLSVNRNRYDFYADRLRVATTEQNLLGAINRYSELLGCPSFSSNSAKLAIESNSAIDGKIVYQWLKDQPKVVIAISRLNPNERREIMNEFVRTYQPIEINTSLVKPRSPFDINMIVTVTQALSHGDDVKAGNAQLFRRCSVRGGLRLPFYSGNAIGGAMRDLLADHFLQSLGIPIDKSAPVLNIWAFHLLYSGGVLSDGGISKEFERLLTGAASGSMRSDGVRQLRNMIPFFSMMGGIGKSPIESQIYINDLRPQCLEWGTGDISVNDMMTWRYFTRRDDYEGKTSNAQLQSGDSGVSTANTSMIVNTECMTEGTILDGGIDVSNHISEIEMSSLARGLLLLQNYGYLGGKKHRGFGRVTVEYISELNFTPTSYDEYLKTNKDIIIKYLSDADFFSKEYVG